MEKISKYNEKYPLNFLKIKNAPEQLYVDGDIELLNEFSVAIVGSRNCSIYGEKMATKFSRELANIGMVTVSGMALGIDSIVHEKTIENHGRTIAVLPSGLKNIYPKVNEGLYKKIIENGGLIISEYEPNVKADSNKFLNRNRLVSALSECLIVVEAQYRSGTSVTARYAKEQGKKVFCVPSGLDNRCGIGTNRMIKNGATLLSGVSDIFEEIDNEKMKEYKEKYNIQKNIRRKKLYIPEGCENLYKIIREKPTSIDYIFNKLNEPISEISYKLTLLELEGLIKTMEGGFYEKIE